VPADGWTHDRHPVGASLIATVMSNTIGQALLVHSPTACDLQAHSLKRISPRWEGKHTDLSRLVMITAGLDEKYGDLSMCPTRSCDEHSPCGRCPYPDCQIPSLTWDCEQQSVR